MVRSLPRPDSIIGYRKDGRPIRPILGASEDDTSNPGTGGALAVDQETLGKLLARKKEQSAEPPRSPCWTSWDSPRSTRPRPG